MSFKNKTVLVIGSLERTEFASARDWLSHNARARFFATVDEAVDAIKDGIQDPETILFSQNRPGQFASVDVQRLRTLAPLTPIAVLLGSWNEGETRSGFPLPDVRRIHWTEAVDRFAEDTSRLPATVSDQVRLRHQIRGVRSNKTKTIAVYSADPAQCDAIAETIASEHRSAVRLAHPSPETASEPTAIQSAPGEFDCVIWDDSGGRRNRRIDVSELARDFSIPANTPIISLRTFPRTNDLEKDVEWGVVKTIAKPFPVADLLAAIDAGD